MSDDYEYNHRFENYVQKQHQEAVTMKITKIIIAKDGGELKEMVNLFGSYCVGSSDAIAKEMRTFTSSLRLAEYLDEKVSQGLISKLETEVVADYEIDLSGSVDEVSFELFGFLRACP